MTDRVIRHVTNHVLYNDNWSECVILCDILLDGAFAGPASLEFPSADGAFEPVSYTHLDVYKRQG